MASLAGKGIKYVASSFGKTIVKAGKKLGEGVTMVAGKARKAAVDGIKTASHKVKEGVNFVASTAKGFADKIGNLWNKGATTVKTTFLQGNEKIQHAVKTLLEYKWIPGEGKGFAIAGVGNVSGGGQYSLKEAYQYMESKVVKGTGEALGNKKVAVGEEIIAQRVLKAELDLTPKLTPYKSLSRGQQKKIKEKIENRTVTKEEYKRYQWDKRFSKRRAAGVNEFWKQEKKRILDGEPTTRDWTNEQIQEILKGKKPQYNGKSIIGHHTYNAMNYPHICNRGELIYPVTGREHLKGWHGGSYSKNAPGRPVNPNYLEEF